MPKIQEREIRLGDGRYIKVVIEEHQHGLVEVVVAAVDYDAEDRTLMTGFFPKESWP